MNKIELLPQNLINKIAAGEVVERPASILKELLENSVDAKATDIQIKISKGGLGEVTVIDNGIGIPADEIELAFTQHATSKLKSEEDLSNINSLGFRGEALPSIASAADVEMHTFREGSQPTFVKYSNSELVNKETKPRNNGTTISVFDLFRYIPARKKFLSSENTEYRHLYNIFLNIAIPNYQIQFTLYKDGNKTKSLLPRESVEQRIADLINIDPDNDLIGLFYNSPALKISGFIGHPRSADDKSPRQYIFLNGRAIQEKTIYSAVKEGFGNTIPRDRKPSYFINIDIEPSLVDVNVHPRKNEVRFTDSSSLFRAVKQTVEKALEKSLSTSFSTLFSESNTIKIEDEIDQPKAQNFEVPYIPSTGSYSKPKIPNKPNEYYKPSVSQGIKFTQNLLSPNTQTDFNINSSPVQSYYYIGQVFKTYLIYVKEDKFIMIDQHAADERVNFEKYENAILKGESIVKQPLLLPYTFDVSGSEKESLTNLIPELNNLGIEISELGGDTFQLSSIPTFMYTKNYEEFIDAIISDLSESKSSLINIKEIQNKLIATIACHSSIRAGDILSESQANKIIKDLFNCQKPYSCPHGRPIIWELTKNEISKNFERS